MARHFPGNKDRFNLGPIRQQRFDGASTQCLQSSKRLRDPSSIFLAALTAFFFSFRHLVIPDEVTGPEVWGAELTP